MTPIVHRVGTRAVLVELPELIDVMAWHASLSAQPLPGQTEVIAAATTVLVKTSSPRSAQQAALTLRDYTPTVDAEQGGQAISIDVVYDGEDLSEVASLLSISTEELITRHTSETWLAAFGGFAPGFTYCVPTVGEWDVARRDSPRTQVPAGAVGLAGNFSAVYPRTSPGGWQLIGHTDTPMWNPANDSPALLSPGDTVTYRAVRERVAVAPAPRQEESSSPAQPALTVLSPGLQTLFQDLGRPGHGDIGVNSSGAVDRGSAWTANSLLGNDRHATLLENIGGLSLEALVDTVLAVTGAHAEVTITDANGASSARSLAAPLQLTAGSTLTVSPPTEGMRNYLAVRGGFVAPETLGSSSTDILSGLGPAPVSEGETLSVGDAVTTAAVGKQCPNPLLTGDIRCVRGPRADWFSREEQHRFSTMEWSVTSQSNRVGVRLDAPEPLTRTRDGELASEGMISGSIQVPPNGLPVIFLADHPVTGGYPVIGTVVAEDLDIVAQLSPGATVRFVFVDPDTFTEDPS
ncbi:KipI antagonist [Corynebacterium atrinae]|uniref:5-oxoprolinase subunit B/C family protein n=1 Tax=Corynebacterium atrinae TaxID=1336740 RepID=UPI0025B5325D|nr:urea amidolyase family protein [Corynebacterium atrinae]WJY62591.1 KipI antagonist [Corynebacterium atrinae]